jgi:hypothetical protein
MEKCFVVDLLQIFKKWTAEIRHHSLCRHFDFFQKSSFMLFCVSTSVLTLNVTEFFLRNLHF